MRLRRSFEGVDAFTIQDLPFLLAENVSQVWWGLLQLEAMFWIVLSILSVGSALSTLFALSVLCYANWAWCHGLAVSCYRSYSQEHWSEVAITCRAGCGLGAH